MKFSILIFYKYVEFGEPEKFREGHLDFCTKNDILGRVWISHEGINGTVSGTFDNIERYKNEIKSYPEFKDIWFKEDLHQSHAFRKIHVRVKDEIVTTGFGELDLSKTGQRIEPSELLKLYKENNEFVIVDVRNDYESNIGKFKDSVIPGMKTFRDWPGIVEKLVPFKNKKVITYCTGGIRCEKASAYLIAKGFTDVYQLEGGIWNYINNFPDTYWEGSVFVFDERRIVTPNTREEIKHIGKCFFCGCPTSYYINCHNQDCDKLLLTCDKCKIENAYCCSEECRNSANKRVKFHG